LPGELVGPVSALAHAFTFPAMSMPQWARSGAISNLMCARSTPRTCRPSVAQLQLSNQSPTTCHVGLSTMILALTSRAEYNSGRSAPAVGVHSLSSPMDRLIAEWLAERARNIGPLIRLTDEQFNAETAPGQWISRVVAKHVLSLEQDSLKTVVADRAAREGNP
jgi:hypothetical protein